MLLVSLMIGLNNRIEGLGAANPQAKRRRTLGVIRLLADPCLILQTGRGKTR
jgi:hypothetical protein